MSGGLADGAARTLAHLPDELLRAMARGLRAHADDLAPGVLFRTPGSRGCAVGITLRELAPAAFDFGWLRFWLWQRWRRGVERDVARRFPRINHLQWQYDEAAAGCKAAGHPEPAKAVGLWLAASAEAELRTRRGADAETRPRTERAARRARRPARARGHKAETSGAQADPEVHGWS